MDKQLPHSFSEVDKEDTARVKQYPDHSASIDLDAPEDTVLKDDQEKYMNFTSIADKAFVDDYNLDVSRVPVLDLEQWPSKEALRLDEFQYRACQLALTNRFALIQGPPGTGKTYVGLKIAHALLENPALWNDERPSPILMVAYTNHALDQFLMGIENKQGIVRVGGRSRVAELQQFSLKTLRGHRHCYSVEKGRTLDEKSRIEQMYHPDQASRLIADSENAVLSVSTVKHRIEAKHLRCFENELRNNHYCKSLNDVLLRWLRVEQLNRHPRRKGTGQPDRHYNVSSLRNYMDDDKDDEDEQSSSAIACSLQDAKNPDWLRKNLQSDHCMSANEVVYTELYKRNIFQLTHVKRWQLYRVWRSRIATDCQQRIYQCQDDGYENALKKLEEIKTDENLEILQSARVIGMTTTCAAKNRTLLQRVRPKIVIVEEAAEVLEVHILTSLPFDCEHVILIGDHQQLRPSCTVYKLAKEFKLNISMFERLVNLGMPCERLSEQHRMRPEIASLMKHIYKDLHNHTSVNDYEHIRGFQHNIFFIDHRYPEEENEDTHSHVNNHEAEFLVKVCRYLMQQDYRKPKITILTPYLGQMFTIKEKLGENLGEEDPEQMVRLSTIDNYQGEENDIILLSLVRSNDAGHAGFVNDINRACVALSRARMGLYVIGNFELLAKASEIWKKVVADLKEKGQLGEALPLVCQSHKKEILLTEPKEFDDKVPCGGCAIACQARLSCGHACTRACHPYDKDHLLFRCLEQCTKTVSGCTFGHVCQNVCWETCEDKCTRIVERTLQCGHNKQAQCSDKIARIKCDERCEKLLQCGHQCQSKCGVPCTLACNELVERTDWPCGHEVTIACSATPLQCSVPCSLLTCGHECSGKCGECLQGRVHKSCTEYCARTLICGHQCTARCTNSCPPCGKTCETKCIHSKCKNTCGQSCVPCKYHCHWECKHLKCNMECGEVCDRSRCNKRCRLKVKPCRHVCRGLCGDSCICVICQKDKIQEIFGTEDLKDESVRFIQLEDCKHIFEVNGLDQWMDTKNTDESGENKSVQMKVCPVCKAPIRTTMRYKQVVNKQLKDIEEVKKVILGDEQNLDDRRERLKGKFAIYLAGIPINEGRHLKQCEKKLTKRVQTCKTNFALTLLENQATLLVRCQGLIEKVLALKGKQRDGTNQDKKITVSIIQILEYLKTTRIVGCNVERELKDFELEINRQNLRFEVVNLVSDTKEKAIDLKPEHQELLGGLTVQLCQASRLEETEQDSCLSKVKEARSKYPIDLPTRKEKDQIVKAIGLGKGHWFKCPQGHIYAIGECGGATERGTCPECRAVIGGASHKLAEGNQLAPEMDGSQVAAWSEQANLENYVIGDMM